MKRSSFCSTKMFLWVLLTMALVYLIMSCSRDPKPTESEVSVSTIKSLVIVPPTIQEGQTGVVDVVVEDDANNPVSGVIVSFSVSPSDIGSCSPQVDTTDASGSAGGLYGGGSAGGYALGFAGTGGGLGYKNNISVTPGNSYTVVVGAGGTGTGGNNADGAGGAVRIIWGTGRSFPSTNTADV